uniref:Uncharacterized protein n=1 Tax=Sparus aurata TaxID=8175 RepID=A0A671Y9J9_SPAAU
AGNSLAYSLQNDQWCKSWDKVIANTGFHDWGYNPKHSLKRRLRIIKGSVTAGCGDKECNPLYLTLTNPNVDDTGLYVLGSYQSGTDPLGHFQINVGPKVTYLHNVTYESKLALETGYDDKNLWLEWMRYTTIQTDKTDYGLLCTIQLFGTNATDAKCKTLSLLYPPVVYPNAPPSVIVYAGNYTCFSRTGQGINVGPLPNGYCTETINITSDTGNYTAAMKLPHSPYHRSKRDAPGGSFDPKVYVDAIGVPRGVPNEFKARNQIIAGFESLFHWVSINKNVDWINYINYNQQRFINYTRNAVKGIAEQLDPTSLMTWQNRMALDMLLAEKGGVCKMFGEYCCTYIPNNTAPDGSITIALAGRTSLSQELAENSGVNDPITSWLDSQFGRYKALIASMLISIGCFLAIIVCCGCCCIPCLRTLVNRLITTALSREKEPSPYAMPLIDNEAGSEDREAGDQHDMVQ